MSLPDSLWVLVSLSVILSLVSGFASAPSPVSWPCPQLYPLFFQLWCPNLPHEPGPFKDFSWQYRLGASSGEVGFPKEEGLI